MSASVPGRAVYDYSGFRLWNTVGLVALLAGGTVGAVLAVREGDPLVIAFMVVWFAIGGFIARGLLFVCLYRLEVDDHRLYWRRRGVEQSAELADIESVSTSSNLATLRFRDGRRPLKVMIGGGFQEFLSHLGRLRPDIELGGGGGFGPFGGGFTRS